MSFLICWSWLLVFKWSANFSNYTIQMLTGKFKLRCFPYNKTLILCTDSTHSFRSKLPKQYFSQLLPLSVGRVFFSPYPVLHLPQSSFYSTLSLLPDLCSLSFYRCKPLHVEPTEQCSNSTFMAKDKILNSSSGIPLWMADVSSPASL